MCYIFIAGYGSCHHFGQPEYISCGISHCPKIVTCYLEEELQDFCPECFLEDDFSQHMQRPWTYGVYMLMNITSPRWFIERQHAQMFYERAARFYKDTSEANDIWAFVNVEEEMFDETRGMIAVEILDILLRDFWTRIKYNISPQPTLTERMLIFQICKVREFDSIKTTMGGFRRKVAASQSLISIVPDAEVSDDYCNICRETFGTADEDGKVEHCVKTKLCNHSFGNVCVASWFASNDEWTCPMCRRQLIPDVPPQQLVAEGNAIEIGSRLKFVDLRGDMAGISRRGTPDWMIALLDATDADFGDNLRPYRSQQYIDDLNDYIHQVNMHLARV